MITDQARILVVDDEKSFTDLMRLNLLDEGFQVKVVNEATKAIDAAKEYKPDVMLLDIVMPEEDGGDVLRKMNADPELSHIPTILVSALVSNSEVGVGSGLESANGVVVAKPVKFDKLRQCIDQVLALQK